MSLESVHNQIRTYIQRVSNHSDFGDDDDLVSRGIVSSLQLLDLVGFVADTFSIDISEADLFDGRFATVTSIAQLAIERRH